MKINLAYFIAESGPVLDACQRYYDDMQKHHADIVEFSRQFDNCTGYQCSAREGILVGLVFDGQIPEGFKKPDKNNIARPKKGSAWAVALNDFQRKPIPYDYLHDLIKAPTCVSYRYKDSKSSGNFVIGNLITPYQICWFKKGGPFLVVTADAPAACKEFLAEEREEPPIFEGDPQNWQIPQGCKRILPEEWDFWAAAHKAQEAA